jgi:hypothetical protein
LTVSGGGFAAGETVNVTYATDLAAPSASEVTLCSAVATADGAFSCGGKVQGAKHAGPDGQHQITVEGAISEDHTQLSFDLVHVIPGDYNLMISCTDCTGGWLGGGVLQLYSNGDATAEYQQSHGTWQNSGSQFSMYLYDMIFEANFTGVVTKSGLNSLAHPGTFGGDENSGQWYATAIG